MELWHCLVREWRPNPEHRTSTGFIVDKSRPPSQIVECRTGMGHGETCYVRVAPIRIEDTEKRVDSR